VVRFGGQPVSQAGAANYHAVNEFQEDSVKAADFWS
jgi:hypothetical protein